MFFHCCFLVILHYTRIKTECPRSLTNFPDTQLTKTSYDFSLVISTAIEDDLDISITNLFCH